MVTRSQDVSGGASVGDAGYPYAALDDALGHEPRVLLVCVAGARGSTPREAGAAMIVTPGGAVGTIGGGRLEFEALHRARDLLAADATAVPAASLVRFPLAASVGQCCGGLATLAFAAFSAGDRPWLASVAAALRSGIDIAIVIGVGANRGGRMSVSASGSLGSLGDAAADAAAIALARGRLADDDRRTPRATVEHAADVAFLLHLPRTDAFDVCLFGNGHVGRALAQVLAALPARVRWIDARDADFPAAPAPNIEVIATDVPEAELRTAPRGAYVVVSTHSHALDFELVAAALARDDWSYLGMIGSRAKRTQLVQRLARQGLPPEAIDRVVCPIGSGHGLPRGKEPGTIAVAVAAELLARRERLRAGAGADADADADADVDPRFAAA